MANNAVRLIAPVLLGALVLLFPADGLRALGLGEARVDSWLGQPLDVSIRLLEVESEAVESVSVGPASLEDYERLGVPSESLGLGLQVTIDRSTDPATVRVRSQRPVDDPIVQILIDARWSSGRVLREYTLFLDPPVMDSAPPAREVSQPAAEPEREPEPAPEREPREVAEPSEPATRPVREPAEPAQTAPSGAADSVRVAPGDTLWGIAEDWRGNRSLSMDQVMLAIFNRNRGAFLGENINRLRSDARLDMPGVDEVRSVDRADAERRVREHMRAWQPGAVDDVPVVSDAATPETTEEPAATEERTASSEEPAPSEEAAQEDSTTGAAAGEEEYRLDVVPPEEDQYSEGSAVAEGDLDRVSERLADVEEEIAASDLEADRFDEHVAEVREALEQRDMAGLAVAEESLAELETRLREAREARAEQERMADAGDGEAATDSEEGDEIADYMTELEEEFGTDDEAAADGEEMAASGEDDAGQMADGSDDEAAQAEEESEAIAGGEEQSADAAPAEEQMAVTQTSGGAPGWLWPAVGVLALILIAAGALFWLRRRRAGEPGEAEVVAGDSAVESARSEVARNPRDLAAHLGLLNALADEGREQEFTDAFDQMYQEVDDESAPEWQEALSLASAHVPDHPLLTPQEEPDEADFDRRADEMLGMLDVDEPESDAESGSEPEAEETFDLGELEESEEARDSGPESELDTGSGDDQDTFDEDMDLAVLSERLDDPDTSKSTQVPELEDTGETDFGEFEESDEYAAEKPAEEATDESPETPVDLEGDEDTGPDLDFTPAQEQEADEVLGEAGAREDEDLDLDFSSEADEVESAAADEGLDFDLGEDEATEPEPDDVAAEDTGAEDAAEADEAGEPEAAEAEEAPEASGGSLSDEDADVKLDLARAYISVDLADSARPVLEEVISDGSPEKQAEARKLLDDLG